MLSPYATLHFGLNESSTIGFLRTNDFDMVIVIDTEEYISALRECNQDVKKVIEVHTSIEKNLTYLSRLSANDADSFITVSEYMIGRIEHHRSDEVSNLTIHQFGNVLDTKLFLPVKVQGSGPPPVMWVGKVDDHKDWRAFFEICGRINEVEPEVEFWLIGGQTCPTDLSDEVFKTAEEMKIIQRFRWFDRIENEKMAELISHGVERGGINLVTSHGKSFGMSVIESLLAGCPVVSTSVGALPEVACDEPMYQLYQLGDFDAATEKCLMLLSDREKQRAVRDELSENRQRLIEEYDSSIHSVEYWNLLRNLMEDGE